MPERGTLDATEHGTQEEAAPEKEGDRTPKSDEVADMVDDDVEGHVGGMEGGAKGAWAREGRQKDEGGCPKGAHAREGEGDGKDGVEATPAKELTPGTRVRHQLEVGNRFICEA